MGGGKKQPLHNVSANRIKTLKNNEMLFSGSALELFAKVLFSWGSCNITLSQREGCVCSYIFEGISKM
jgi:hypothetical protein